MKRKAFKYREYTAAHEKALALELKGYRGIRIDKEVGGLWKLSFWEETP